MKKITWPQTIFEHESSQSKMKLHEHTEDWAFYFREHGFGFGNAIEINIRYHRHKKRKKLVEVKWMSGNSWGKDPRTGESRTTKDPLGLFYLITRTEFFITKKDALTFLTHRRTKGRGKKLKRIDIEPMSNEELLKWCGE